MKVKDIDLAARFFEFSDLREMLRYSAKKYGEKTAFVTKIKEKGTKAVSYHNTSYEELYDEMIALGTALYDRGYKDRRVAIIGENSYKWCLAYFTAANGVGVTVPLDKALEREEIVSCLNRSNSTIIFYDKKMAKLIEDIIESGETNLEFAVTLDFKSENLDRPSIDEMIANGKQFIASGNKEFENCKIDREAMSFLLFTSCLLYTSDAADE